MTLRFFQILLFFVLLSPSAKGAYYFELGAGGSMIQSGSSFFGGGIASTPTIGPGLNLMIAYNLAHTYSLVQIHLGFVHRYSTSTSNDVTYTMNATYPALRLELPRLYLGAGATPLVWQNSGSGLSTTLGSRVDAIAYYAEAGLLWKVVPFFHMAAQTTAQFVSQSGTLSPSPALDVSLQLRFIYGFNARERQKVQYDGWRYPFGIEVQKEGTGYIDRNFGN